MMNRPTIIVIGAGPGGLTAAHELGTSGQVAVTLIQREGLATYLPGILPVLLGLQPATIYRYPINLEQVQVVAGEVVAVERDRVRLADGTVLAADAVIAAPGLATDVQAIPSGPRSFPIWELAEAATAQQAVQALTAGHVVIAIDSLPYRCPPAPYGLAMALKARFQERGQDIAVTLTTPETRPLQPLGERVTGFLEDLLRAGSVTLETAFRIDHAASHDGLLVALDGRHIPYDLGLFVPPHRRPPLLADLPGNGPLVSVDAYLRTPQERLWCVGDVAATPLPRAMGAAEAQGQTAAADVLATLGLRAPLAPTTPALSCYVWTSLTQAAHIQIRFPAGLPPAGQPDIVLDPPSAALFSAAQRTAEQWRMRRSR